MKSEVLEEFDEVVEVNCRVKIVDGKARIFGVAFDTDSKRWNETEITELVPLDEALRIQSMADEKRRSYFHKLGKVKGLW